MTRKYVVVEGLIGVGKTTLCRLLERERGAALVLEPAATNPFLEPFYREPARYAFPVQMFYLISRWRQQAQILQGELFSELVVSDYLFEKDRLFAEKTLDAQELGLYDRFAGALGEATPVPDLLIYLDAPLPVVQQRIMGRLAPGEEAIDAAYLEDLRARYERLLADYTAAPILRIDNRDMNYAEDDGAQQLLLTQIDLALVNLPLGIPALGAFSHPDNLGSGTPGSTSDREVQQMLFGGAKRRTQ